jgi:hypothetical protein
MRLDLQQMKFMLQNDLSIHNHLLLVQTVNGELDDKNQWLKTRLEGLHKIANTPFMSEEFRKVTQQIQKWL